MNRSMLKSEVTQVVGGLTSLVIFAFVLAIVGLTACTDASRASGSSADVTCYSGGQVIYKGKSTGRFLLQQSDGWEFQEAGTGKFVRVSGDCVVIN